MKKSILTIFILISYLYPHIAHSSGAANKIVKGNEKQYAVRVDGVGNYPPFSWVEYDEKNSWNKFYSVFTPLIDKLTEKGNVKLKYNYNAEDIDSVLSEIRKKDGGIFVGALSQSEKFKDIALIYPAPLYNPITVFMLPDKISDVKSVNDLKGLKGIRYSHEILSDFIYKQVSAFNIEETDSPYEMFKKLFNHEVDYILCGYYFGIIEAVKLGVKHQIAPANKALWNIPVFVGISKMAKDRKVLTENLSRLLNDDNNVKMLKNNLNKIVSSFEAKHQGRIPETFGLENKK